MEVPLGLIALTFALLGDRWPSALRASRRCAPRR